MHHKTKQDHFGGDNEEISYSMIHLDDSWLVIKRMNIKRMMKKKYNNNDIIIIEYKIDSDE